MSARLGHIFRYPVKSAGGESLDRVVLTPDQPLPGDRRFAVLHGDALHHLEGDALRRWLPKAAFLRGAAAGSLQAITGGWRDGLLVLSHPDLQDLAFDPLHDQAAVLDWLAPLWADSGKAPPARLVEGVQALTDVSEPWLSVLSLSSLRALEAMVGQPLGTHRFRANLWISGWEPFAERDMQLHRIRIGSTVELTLTRRIGRCAATCIDTATGRFDVDLPAALEKRFLHRDFGIYARVAVGGTIRQGDEVTLL